MLAFGMNSRISSIVFPGDRKKAKNASLDRLIRSIL
jgi:hypothetical protein